MKLTPTKTRQILANEADSLVCVRRQVFAGNTDSYSTHHVYLNEPVMARFVKFHTLSWHHHPSLRVEIIGCQGLSTSFSCYRE